MEITSRPEQSAPDGLDGAGTSRVFLIADIRGYTAFTREHGDEAAARLAGRFAEVARDAVEARSGRIPELRGDEALAVFVSSGQAVRAAAELQAACQEETAADPTLPLHVGVGIDVGEAVPLEGGYRGGALNMAARLCAKAGAGQVLVTREVAALAAEAPGVRFEERGSVELKGFDASIDILESVSDLRPLPLQEIAAARPGGIVGRETEPVPPELDPISPMVDRQHEMRWLRGTWRQARRGKGRLVFVSGPAGIGKRRLVAELAREIHGRTGIVRYAGAGGAGTALAVNSIREATTASTATLLVVNELDVLGEEVTEALAETVEEIADSPVLIVGAFRDASGLPALASLVERVDERGDAHRSLPPLDASDVAEIAGLYVGANLEDVPVESMLRASRGVPGSVHEVVSDWARNEAKRRLAAAAEWLAAGRDRRTADLEFANNVISLRLGRLYTGGKTEPDRSDVCPFKGLDSFDVEDAAYFFGRERLVGELAARTVGTGLLGVVGPSGSGKSSVVLAGLVPSLAAGLLPGSERWRHAVMRPGDRSMEELASALEAVGVRANGDAGPLGELAASVSPDTRLVLVVDQFEEVFTGALDEAERDAFVGSLVRAAVEDPDRVVVVLTIRADFYGHLAVYPSLADLLGANHVLVGPMAAEELSRAIELPARRVGLRVEASLAEELVAEVVGETGGLPLLSTALVELWRGQEEGWLRRTAYERTGGVRGAVARLAESSHRRLSDVQRQVARNVFLRLVASGEGEAAVKRRVAVAEFDVDRDPTAGAVISRLTEDRLLTVSDGTVEVAHEALIREWPRLRGWLEEDVEGRRVRGNLTQAARQWDEAGRGLDELYRGARLSATLDWAATHLGELNELERAFLSESRLAGEREAERQRRTNRRLRGLLVGVASLLVLALVAGGLALVQRGRAQQEARVATARELASAAAANLEADPELSLLLAIEAVGTTREADGTVLREAEQVLHAALNSTRVTLSVPGRFGVAFSPVGSRLATNRGDGTVSVWDVTTGVEVLTLSGHTANVMNLIYSFDGRWIATGSEDHTAKVWNAETGRELLTLTGHEDIVISPAFSSDRSFLATTSHDGTTRIWDTRTAEQLLEVDGGPGLAFSPVENHLALGGAPATVLEVPSGRRFELGVDVIDVAFSPDGNRVAYGELTDRTARVVDVATGKEVVRLSGHEGVVEALDFSPDGTRLATASDDGAVRVWDLETEETLFVLSGHGASVENVDFSPDGNLVVGGSSAGTALVWDITREGSRELLTKAVGPPDDFYRAAYSPDGSRFVVMSFHGTVRAFDAATGRQVLELPHPGPVLHALYSPDGSRVATASADGTVRIWDAGSGDEPLVIPAHAAPVSSVAFSTDGSRIATAGIDGVATVWDAATGEPDLTLSPGLGSVFDVAFSPDGSRLVTTHQDDRAVVWDASDGDDLGTLEHANTVFGVAFSSDGSRFATGSADGKVRVWKTEDAREVFTLEGHEAGVFGVAFSPGGQLLASGSADRTAKLWNVSTGEEVLALTGHDAEVTSVAFSPDGRRLLTASADGTVRVYALDVDELIGLARNRLTRGFTDQECRTYLHLGRCPRHPGP